MSNNGDRVSPHFQTNLEKYYVLRRIFDSLLGVWNYTRLKGEANNDVWYFVVFRKCAYNLKTLSTDRNFTGKATATQLTNTSYRCQLLQDTFALIQLNVMLGTVSEWKLTELNVSYYPNELTNFLTAKPKFKSQFFEALS